MINICFELIFWLIIYDILSVIIIICVIIMNLNNIVE